MTPLIVDFDDFSENNHKLDRLHSLKALNPALKCTLFTVAGQCTPEFLAELPEWMEIALHGWMHPDPYECMAWTKQQLLEVMDYQIVQEFFVEGFKAPGWQISDGCYDALVERGWWVADQHYNDDRRPPELPVHCEGDGHHWHGHIQDVCGNGIEETWPRLTRAVSDADSFLWVSEAVR